MKVAVIGTAGRGEVAKLLTLKHFGYMIDMIQLHTSDEDTLVSGGAAWADHSTIAAWNKTQRIFLHLPCPWDPEKKQFRDTGERDWRTNPGGTANYYHRAFQKVVGFSSLEDLHQMWKLSTVPGRLVIWCEHKGFFERNNLVGNVDKIIAFTFGPGDVPADGGTKHTWDNSRAPTKIHLSLRNV